MKEERVWLNLYNYVQNNPINRVDPTGALDEESSPDGTSATININGSYWQKERIVKELAGGDSKATLTSFATALVAINTTINDIEPKNRKYANSDWRGDSPATLKGDLSTAKTVTVNYGDGRYFTVQFDREKSVPIEKDWIDIVLDFFSQLDDAVNGGGGIRFTWSIGQGQETRKAKGAVETVTIDDIMSAFGITKTASGVKQFQNLAAPLSHLFNSFSTGHDLMAEIQARVEGYKNDPKIVKELEKERNDSISFQISRSYFYGRTRTAKIITVKCPKNDSLKKIGYFY